MIETKVKKFDYDNFLCYKSSTEMLFVYMNIGIIFACVFRAYMNGRKIWNLNQVLFTKWSYGKPSFPMLFSSVVFASASNFETHLSCILIHQFPFSQHFQEKVKLLSSFQCVPIAQSARLKCNLFGMVCKAQTALALYNFNFRKSK